MIVAPTFNVSEEITSLTAMLSVPYCFLRPKDNLKEADECRMK
jgi:pre-mRNA-splicing factor ATP-dependent RNA helicase DHX15/PRP43